MAITTLEKQRMEEEVVISSDDDGPLFVSVKDLTGMCRLLSGCLLLPFIVTVKYFPQICGKVDASVVAVGQIGVWRASQCDFVSDVDYILHDINKEEEFQPERHYFHVMEISKGRPSQKHQLVCEIYSTI